jgi:hypothetical protein
MSKIEAFWENATANDVARVMAGETVEARFRDSETQPWGDCYTLTGWVNELRHQWRSAEAGGRWNFCQVYREPSWFTDKPDPGPGFRLLEKFPDEPKLATDEALQYDGTTWNRVRMDSGVQDSGVWYRRRIEPVEVVEPDVLHYVLLVGESAKLPNGQTITATEKGFEVTQ